MRRTTGKSVLDVGGRDTPIVTAGRFERRLLIDKWKAPKRKRHSGVEYNCVDFMKWWPADPFDLVICLQTLEHIDDQTVASFARKLFAVGRNVIISVPFMWDDHGRHGHLQNCINHEDLYSWTKRIPSESHVTKCHRLVTFYGKTDLEYLVKLM